jgi:hypothetical protein
MKTYIWESRNIEETVHNWRRTCDENGVSVRTDKAVDAFARVLCGGVVERGHNRFELLEENEADLPTDSQWSEFWATGYGNAFPRCYTSACSIALYGRILYVTISGRIGLSLPNVKVGDEIWVIHGSNVPFILRRQSETPTQHRLVGDTYLQGVMDGSCARGDDSVRVVLVSAMHTLVSSTSSRSVLVTQNRRPIDSFRDTQHGYTLIPQERAIPENKVFTKSTHVYPVEVATIVILLKTRSKVELG